MANKSNVTFIDTSAEVKKTMAGLSKSALRASGKEVRQLLRERIGSSGTVHVHTDHFKNHIGTWAFIDRKTGQPQLQVGFYSAAKVRSKNKKASHASPHWIEFGTNPHSMPGSNKQGHFMAYGDNVYGFHVNHPGQNATHLLRDPVQQNAAQIRAAQEKYLAELNKTLEEAGAKVYEGEEDESD